MIRHVLKLVWNRKRSSFLLILEMAISFIVLFAVAALALYCYDGYRRPLGFSYDDVWSVQIDAPGRYENWGPEAEERVRQLLLAARGVPDVVAAARVSAGPFGNSHDVRNFDTDGRVVEFESINTEDALRDVLKIPTTAGRWFSADDDGAGYQAVVVNERLARDLYPGQDPIGKPLSKPGKGSPEQRIVGVVSDFRKNGELSAAGGFAIFRADPRTPGPHDSENILIRFRPGTAPGGEARILASLSAVGRDWSFEIRPLAEMRTLANQALLVPLFGAILVAAFLILMVALGLIGVLWQNVTQRTKEIGLRRAKGATARDIQKQILGELVVLSSAGILLGGVIAIQFPLLSLVGSIPGHVVAFGLVVSILLLYGLTLLCGAYPSRLASRVTPAEALHYE